MAEIRLLAAIGRRQLLEAFRLAGEQPFVVFGTLDGQVMSRIDRRCIRHRPGYQGLPIRDRLRQ